MQQSEACYDSALIISNSIDDKWYKGEILYYLGLNLYNKGKEMEALESYNQALQYSRLSQNFAIMGSTYSMMGNIYRVNGLYDRAIEYIIKSKLNYEKANFQEGYGWAAYLLGRIYADLKLEYKAREYFKEALQIYEQVAEKEGDKRGLAICYEQLGLLSLTAGNLREASRDIDNSLRIYSENGSKYGISNAYKNLGKIEYAKGNYTVAEEYLNKALARKQEIGDVGSLSEINQYLGLCYLSKGEKQKGFEYLQKGLDYAVKNNQRKVQFEIYGQIAKAYLHLNDLKRAFDAQQKQVDIQGELLSGAAKIKLEQLQSIYAIDEKNEQIAELEHLNAINTLEIKQHKITQIIAITAIVLAFLIAVSVYFFYRKIRRKNKALKEAIATKDRLFSIIAHDLRNPIGSSLGLSEFFVEEINNKNFEVAAHYAGLFQQSLNEAFALLNNLLDWSRSQLQQIKFAPRRVKLAGIVTETQELFGSTIQKKKLEFQVNIAEDTQVVADIDMLKTILRNLISNAIKYSEENNRIIIESKVVTKFIEIAVIDQGIGMSPEGLRSLFEFESNSSTPGTAGEKGTGLGLLLVKEFVEKHGGQIRAASTEGKGSTFSFTIPAAN
jgi:signal transduction histidine kinase